MAWGSRKTEESGEEILGLDGAEALEVPGGVKEVVEDDGFDGALGVEFGEEGGAEFVELFLLAGGDDELPGGESVSGGVLRGAGLAFFGARTGGGLGVGLVGDDLGGGCHG